MRRAPGVASDHDQETGDGVAVEVHVCDSAHHEEGREDEDAARDDPPETMVWRRTAAAAPQMEDSAGKGALWSNRRGSREEDPSELMNAKSLR